MTTRAPAVLKILCPHVVLLHTLLLLATWYLCAPLPTQCPCDCSSFQNSPLPRILTSLLKSFVTSASFIMRNAANAELCILLVMKRLCRFHDLWLQYELLGCNTLKPNQIEIFCFLSCSIASLQTGLRPPLTQAVPAKWEGAKNSWVQPWGYAAMWLVDTVSDYIPPPIVGQTLQNPYRTGPVTEPTPWKRSECKGQEAVKDRKWNFKH